MGVRAVLGRLTEAGSEAPITIVLADDHAVVRSGLRMVLEREPGFEVVAEAGDADAALRTVLATSRRSSSSTSTCPAR